MWGPEQFLLIEWHLANRIPDLGGGDSTKSVLVNFARHDECGNAATTILAQPKTEGDDAGDPMPVLVDPCVINALARFLEMKQELDAWGVHQHRADAMIGEAIWKAYKLQQGLVDSTPGLNWFFNSGDSAVACASSSLLAWEKDVRRCNEYAQEKHWSSYATHKSELQQSSHFVHFSKPVSAWHQGTALAPGATGVVDKTIPVARHLSSYGIDWSSPTGRSDFDDLVASDVRLPMVQNDDRRNRDWKDGMAIEMDEALDSVSASDRHSEVRVITDTVENEGIISFRIAGCPRAESQSTSWCRPRPRCSESGSR